jgi:hypothetical protein
VPVMPHRERGVVTLARRRHGMTRSDADLAGLHAVGKVAHLTGGEQQDGVGGVLGVPDCQAGAEAGDLDALGGSVAVGDLRQAVCWNWSCGAMSLRLLLVS